jgi:acyl-CoA synthetase (AMP-forming)/AMP-acid ligase II
MERIAVFGMNIVDPILFQAKLNPAAPAICVPGAARPLISYGRLERAIHNIGRAALSSGLARGQLAAIHVKDKIFHAALILGLARIGVVTMSARSHSFPPEIGVDAVIADGIATYQNARRVIVAEPVGWMDGDGAPLDDPRLTSAGGDELCRITLTSGSTGEARGIPFTHRLVLERNARLAFTRDRTFQVCSRFYCDLGFATDPGFRDLLRLLYKGGTIFYYGEDPESLVQGLTLYQVQGMMASPEGLSEYLKFYDAYPNIACGLDHIITQGAAMPRALSQHVRARMCSNLSSTYGATETGGITIGSAHVIAETPGAAGYVTPGAEIEIVNDNDDVLPLGSEGRVRLRTAQMVGGYYGDPPEGRLVFRHGWFYPGDIACLRPDGMLIVVGRERALLNFGGDKVRAEILEDVLMSHEAVAHAAAFTHADELGIAKLWAAVVPRSRVDEDALRRHCAQKLGGAFAPAHFAVVQALPMTEGGKLDRARLASLVVKAPPLSS